jgi:phage terminase small subunit
MALSPKQKMFVREYLIDLNATRAAAAAGYSEHTAKQQGSRLLTNVDVKAAIDKKVDARAEKLDTSAEYVLKTIHETVERCRQGEPVRDREGNETGEWKFDAYAVLKGCELLGKHHKMFTDKVEHLGKDGKPLMPVKVILIGKDARVGA